MKFVQKYLTRHHLLHAPHAWFLALLFSPIHVLELHYQKRYHLQFAHARKLFLFDMSLVSAIVVLAVATTSWYWYDPTVLKEVDLTMIQLPHPEITVDDNLERVRSGEHLYYTIHFKNRSNKELLNPSLHLNIPPGFILSNTSVAFATSTRSITLGSIKPRGEEIINIDGTFIGEPDKDYILGVELLYRQAHRANFEVKTNSLVLTPRGSILLGSLANPPTIFPNSHWSADLVIRNINHHAIAAISIPLTIDNNAVAVAAQGKPTLGYLDKNVWKVSSLLPQESATLTLKFAADAPNSSNELPLFFSPQLEANNQWFNQSPIGNILKILHPKISTTGAWTGTAKVSPGETVMAEITIVNSGDVDLHDVTVKPALPSSIVSPQQFAALNQSLKIKNWPRGASQFFTLKIPISRTATGNKNLKLNPKLAISARADGLLENFTTTGDLPELIIGTHVVVSTEARYYSPEGDQLGRGSLPPKVGKETKYWALLHIENATSDVENVLLKATLAPGIQWTGKTSVSRGREPMYNPSTRVVTWEISSLTAFDSADVNFEVSLTPTELQKGTTPLLLNNIHATAFDTYIEKNISATGAALDSSLPRDVKARQKGVIVE